MRYLLAALFLIAAQPSWALYKCVGAGGSVSFQERPCDGAQTQTAIKPLIEAPRPATGDSGGPAQAAPPAAAGARPSLAQQNQQAEAERLRFEAQYKLRDKLAELERQRDLCDREQRAILANRARANNNLAGAMYEQSVATEASAAATRCETRGRDLQAEVEEARRVCATRGCT
jgi:hypothetical protein